GHAAAQQEHGKTEDQVHGPGVFMVCGQQPAADAFGRAVVMFLAVGICNRTHENPRYRRFLWLVIVVIWRRLLLVLVIKNLFRCDHLAGVVRSEEHTSELQSRENLVCRLLLEKKNKVY